MTVASGILNPKLNAIIMVSFPEEGLATVAAGISSLFTLSMVLGKLFMAALILVLSARQLSSIFVLLSLGFLGYPIINNYTIHTDNKSIRLEHDEN
ncbi:hypothetical protein STRIC_0745 [Streptococcus ictaluri 707-05]|uniref:Uncharacterized protein n=2 Tax=Streptococcus ictaluri TaxID=380397 RepID=G5JZN2_9STRE|nr:hypothetical protein STRIC_0745 [Streptococcus ictaluri 707-05]